MIDIRRYHGLVATAVGLTAAVAVWNIILLCALGPNPALFSDPERQMAWNPLEKLGAQLSGVEHQLRREGLGCQRPFAVVLGQSTALHGIDPVLLKQQVEPHMRWLLLNGFGSSFIKLNYYAQPFIASKLRPASVVLGLNPTMLAGYNRENENETAQGITAKKKKRRRRWDIDPIPGLWVLNHRKNISYYTNMYLFESRLKLFKQADWGVTGLFPPAQKPWQVLKRRTLPTRRPDSFLQQQKYGWERFGWFQPGSYKTTGRQADAFRDLIVGCQEMGAERIIIVLLPVSSQLRGWTPPEAQARMRELIDEVSIDRPIVVIDLQDTMADDAFADYAHMNPAGREAFSAILAEHLTDLLNKKTDRCPYGWNQRGDCDHGGPERLWAF